MNAVVLAGGSAEDPLAKRYAVATKALVPIGGRPMVAHVLQALVGSGVIERIVFVGPGGKDLAPSPDEVIEDQGALLKNLEVALEHLPEGRFLVVTADVPLVNDEAVRWVVENAPNAGLVYPIIPKEAIEARWPGMRRTYVRFVEGVFTGGNLLVVDRTLLRKAMPIIRRVIELRKRPLSLARLVGFPVLLRLIFGRLGLSWMEARASQVVGVSIRALITPHPEIGVDVDKEDDLQFMEGIRSA